MLNQSKSRGRKQNVIQSRFNPPSSHCIPAGVASWAMRVHHHHMLMETKLAQAHAIVDRFHKATLSLVAIASPSTPSVGFD